MELPGGVLCEGALGRAVTECAQGRGELWALLVIPAGWWVGAAAGRAGAGAAPLPCCCGWEQRCAAEPGLCQGFSLPTSFSCKNLREEVRYDASFLAGRVYPHP